MLDAKQSAPKTCKVCKKRLPKPRYGYPWASERYGYPEPLRRSPQTGKLWFITCECLTTYVWSYHPKLNGCWKLRSELPLWDTKEEV